MIDPAGSKPHKSSYAKTFTAKNAENAEKKINSKFDEVVKSPQNDGFVKSSPAFRGTTTKLKRNPAQSGTDGLFTKPSNLLTVS
jgi:hypothetical protein